MNEWNLNIVLIAVLAAALIKMVDGYRKGIVKEVISLVSLIVLSVVEIEISPMIMPPSMVLMMDWLATCCAILSDAPEAI